MLAFATLHGQAPLVLALAGLPGAGKSTLASGLSRMTAWPVLDRDAIRAETWPGLPAADARGAADAALLRRVGSGLRAGLCLIVDGKTWAGSGDRLALAEAVEEAGGHLQWIELAVTPAEARARVCASASTHPADDRDEALVDAIAARFEPLPANCWRLDAAASPEAVLQSCLALLAARLGAVYMPDSGASVNGDDRADS